MCNQNEGLSKELYLGWEIKEDMHEGQMGHDYISGLQGSDGDH
jgi:hypothetical protein